MSKEFDKEVAAVCFHVEEDMRTKGGTLLTLGERILVMSLVEKIMTLEQRVQKLEKQIEAG